MVTSSVSSITSRALSKATEENRVSTSNLKDLVKGIKKEVASGNSGTTDVNKAMSDLRALNKMLNEKGSRIINTKNKEILSAGALLVKNNPNQFGLTRLSTEIGKLAQANRALSSHGLASASPGVIDSWQNQKNSAENKIKTLNKDAIDAAKKLIINSN